MTRDPNSPTTGELSPRTSPRRDARGAQKSAATVPARVAASAREVAPTTAPAAFARRSGVGKNVAVMTIAAGLVATIALPAYAFSPTEGTATTGANLPQAGTQNIVVPADVQTAGVKRDAFTATSEAELAAQKQAAKLAVKQAQITAARTAAVQAQTAQSASYHGPSAYDYLKDPPYPNFSLDQVVAVAKQYIGTPYKFGGATPAAFDCSGYTMFVYAQFGISLPHSGGAQGRLGTRISEADAKPGDVVIIDGGSHVAFYMGSGMMMDAPKPGGFVSIRPIYTSNYFIVRFGI